MSGAGTGEGAGRQVKDALLGYGMVNQVRDFAARVKSGEIAFDPQTTLFFLAGGLNDGRRETATTLANLRRSSRCFASSAGGTSPIALLPTKIPQFAAVGLRLNPAYEPFVPEEAADRLRSVAEPLGRRVRRRDGASGAYGIANTTSACAGRAIFNQDATPRRRPGDLPLYHDGHPSTAVHRIVGKKLFEEIAAHPPAAR